METIIDYVMRLEEEKIYGCFRCLPKEYRDYLARPDEKYDKEYSKERQKLENISQR